LAFFVAFLCVVRGEAFNRDEVLNREAREGLANSAKNRGRKARQVACVSRSPSFRFFQVSATMMGFVHNDWGKMANISFRVNGNDRTVKVAPETPLLWVLRDTLQLTGTKFGCGAGLCGACTVHVEGASTRSCSTPVSQVAGKTVTTIEGLSANGQHPLQVAWIAEEVPQCGYCQSGQIMAAAALLAKTAHPSEDEIASFMAGNICRCGTYERIRRAIQRVANGGGAR